MSANQHQSETVAASPVAKDEHDKSAWSPLKNEIFRALWIATVVTNIGTWVQQVGAASLMTSINASATMIALVQTATALPVFFLALPAGAFADTFDRRKLLILAQGWMCLAAVLLAVLTYLDLTNAWLLLAFTFAIGMGAALSAPALQAVVPELVPKHELSGAVALSGVAINIARAVGPALGGLLIAVSDTEVAFFVNALSFVAVIFVLVRWQRKPDAGANRLPPERVFPAMRLALRYLRHSPPLIAVLVRTGAFIFGGSALWALLPVRAQRELGASTLGYGVLLGMIGAGALLGATVLPRLRSRVQTDSLIAAATLAFAAATVALALFSSFYVLCAALLSSGVAWIVLMSSFNYAAQVAVPKWVKARAIALYFLVFQGGMAIGSVVWGILAERADTQIALIAGGAALACGLLTAWKYRLGDIGGKNFESARGAWAQPQLAGEFGNVLEDFNGDRQRALVTIEYRIPPEKASQFSALMNEVREERLRDGADEWNLAIDAAGTNVWLEVFTVPSWTEHLRQHERVTQSDFDVQKRARAFHAASEPPVIKHFIVERN